MRRDAVARPANYGSIGWWAMLVLAPLIAYWPALRGGTLWDDSSHITAPDLQSFHGLWRIWFDLGATQQYYPILHSAFWIEHRLWGDSVLGYHLLNVFLHAACACLVVLIARRLALPGAWLAGFVFALHPVCVEAVAWIAEQKSTLSGFFCLAALLLYLDFDQSRRLRSYWAATGLFALALLSKSVTATLPAVILVILWWRQGNLRKRDILPLLPFFGLAIPMGLFTAWVERTYVGAVGTDFKLTLVDRLLIAGRDLWFYAAKLFLPVGLTFSYPRWQIDSAVAWQYLYPVGVLAVAAVLLSAAHRRRGPLAAFLIYSGTLFPVLGFLNVLPFRYSWVADHFQYLASLGLIVPISAVVAATAPRLFPAAESRGVALAAVALAVLGVLTIRQSSLYRDEETLYRATLANNPTSWLTHNNLGIVLESKPGAMKEAVAEFQQALKLNPVYGARAHFNLGDAYSRLDPPNITGAIEEYQAGLRLQPDYIEAHNNLGNLLAQIPGRSEEAISELQKVAQLDPNSARAHANLGNALAQAERLPEAAVEFETAVRLNPGMVELRCNLGNALSEIPGRLPDAVAQFQEAVRIDPNFAVAHLLLGRALAQTPGRNADAITEFQAALRLRPGDESIQQALYALQSR